MAEPIFKDVRFDALRNAIYHTERRSFLDLLNRFINFIVIILGASVAAKSAKVFHFEDFWLELSVVFFATLQLVFDFGGRARVHEFLQRRYYELLVEIEQEPDVSVDMIEATNKNWSGKLLAIAADEPMPMRALDAIAYNKALNAITADPNILQEYTQHTTWWQRRMRHIFAFQSASFK